ncbi:radical SAM protein [Bacillus sp. TS-2]|nr:radical SAM protein [Bacillus sp. TS-2]
MNLSVSTKLSSIQEKVEQGIRLNFDDGLYLLQSSDLISLGKMADFVRKQKNGEHVYFIQNTHLNYTNVCFLSCKLCAFGLNERDPRAYSLSLKELEEKFISMQGKGYSELHIVGGVNPRLPFSYYEEMLKLSKKHNPTIHIQAFTAVEIDYISRCAKISVKEALIRLQDAGLGSILGGGAEIFNDDVRKLISGHKTNSKRWLDIHRMSHEIGIRSNASILYGHIEKPEHIIDHFIQLRELQDETNGFQAFFAFAFHPDHTRLAKEFEIHSETTGILDLKILAVARLMLDNFQHIRAFWMMIGQKLAQVSLQFGVNDLDGTVMEEQIVHAAGNDSVQMIPKQSFINMIKETGRIPVERDTLYQTLRVY